MKGAEVRRTAGTGDSAVVERCQACGEDALEPIFFAGYLPPVNTMPTVGTRPIAQLSYPAQLLRCPRCELVQIGLVVDPAILFPPEYPYTSGTTRLLRDNFAELYAESREVLRLSPDDLIVDIGSNDGTLLENFARHHRVRGIEPTDTGKLAARRGIPTLISFFGPDAVESVLRQDGRARLITAANVFAHIADVHSVIDGILDLLGPDGVFISESHYWISLLETRQYDTIYHEHLRYYSLTSLRNLLAMHGLEVFFAKQIPTHGGSIRVYAAREGQQRVSDVVAETIASEERLQDAQARDRFRRDVSRSKLDLYELLRRATASGGSVYGIGAPSRASTLVNYVGLDEAIIDCVCEIEGSHKIGKYMPGTLIPVVDERALFDDQPTHALLFSWHLADELTAKLWSRGYKGDFIIPLPTPRLIRRHG